MMISYLLWITILNYVIQTLQYQWKKYVDRTVDNVENYTSIGQL